MKSSRAVCVSAALLLTVPAFSQQANQFTPRTPLPKIAAVVEKPALNTGRVIVKFKDSVLARLRDGKVRSVAGTNMIAIDQLAADFNVTFSPLIKKTEQEMKVVENRAAAYSGKAQPDLAGMFYVDGLEANLDIVVQRLHAMNIVEFVQWENEYVTAGGDPSCGDSPNSCFDASANAGPFCDDLACCQLVCQIRPFCCDEDIGEWDTICVEIANIFCQCQPPCHDTGGGGADRCAAPILSGGCFDTHPFGGCSNTDCCNLVCGLEPFCCVVEWDDMCRNMASDNCVIDNPDVTPDFTETNIDPNLRLQQYRTASPSAEFFANFGFTGVGYDMQGLWNLGELLLDLGIGTENLSHGRTIRVGIIEHSARVPTSTATGHAQDNPGHEDLATVICEVGQTPFPINLGNISENHGTACLGVAVGEDNGFGVTGIARHAQGYFFPIVSQEEGGRLVSAIFTATQLFEPGDVLSFSIGPGGCGTLASNQIDWTMLRLATDLGITCCVAAGNSCCNLDEPGQFGGLDSGAIIVGACTPGATSEAPGAPRFCRLGFSNHCEDCEIGGGIVHCSAWGTAVTTTGYGDLAGAANDPDRHYTATFNGTSAACPQVAGMVACLQGLAKQFYGIPLSPAQVTGCVTTGSPQCDVQNPLNLPGSPGGFECAGDFDIEEEPNRIGNYTSAVDAGIAVFSSAFFDAAPQVTDISIVLGRKIFGSLFSIKAADNNFFIIDSENHSGGTGTGPTGQNLTYLGQGQITDVIVGATVLQPNLATLDVTGSTQIDSGVPVILFVELYNWRTHRFDFAGFQLYFDGAGGPWNAAVPLGQRPMRYINPDTGRVECRVWTLGLGSTPYRVFHDLINPLGNNLPGPNPGTNP